MPPASDPPAEALPPESSGAPEDRQVRPDTLPGMLPARRVTKAALPSVRDEGRSGERTDDDYAYGPGTSRGPGNAGGFGGGAYQGPTSDGYSQHAPDADYAESTYVEPRYEEPLHAQGNSGHQDANSWFAAPDQAPDYPAYGGRHRGEGYGGQGPQHWQAPPQPPVPPNAQGYHDRPPAGYPGPSGGHSGRPAVGFPPNGFPPPANRFPPPDAFQPGNGFPPANGYPPPEGFPSPPPGGRPSPPPEGFQPPPTGGRPSPPPGGSPSPPPEGFQSPPTGSPFPPGFPSPPRPGEFQGFQPPNFPGGQPPGFGGQQAEGVQQTAAFPGPQPGIGQPPFLGPQPSIGQPPFPGAQFGQMPFGGPAGGPPKATPWHQRLGSGKPRLLIGGAVAVVVVAGGAALAIPKLSGPSDPGCASYTGTALTAYNQTISDLNAQASQSQLTGDMTTAIADLTTATDQAQSATVKSALDGLRSELSTVRADVQKGSVSAQTVTALNSASRTADNAC